MESPDTAALVLRVVVGLTIIAHGYNHIFGPGGIQGTAGWFASMGLRPGIVHAWTSGLMEVGAGTALVFGFLTPLSAGAIAGIMVVAGITAHRKNGFFIFKPGQGYEYVLMIAVVCVAVGVLGPGSASVDNALGIDFGGWAGGLVTLGLGVGGSAALLGAAWRPDPPKPTTPATPATPTTPTTPTTPATPATPTDRATPATPTDRATPTTPTDRADPTDRAE